jgi:hypothetical protein
LKADFYDWKRHPVTLEVFQQIEDRMKYATEVLVANAGVDNDLTLGTQVPLQPTVTS